MAERDIESLRMMVWGLMLAESSSAAVAAAAVAVPSGWGPTGGVLDLMAGFWTFYYTVIYKQCIHIGKSLFFENTLYLCGTP